MSEHEFALDDRLQVVPNGPLVPDGEDNGADGDGEVINLTDEANQTWLDEPGPSEVPLRLLKSEAAKQDRRDRIDAIHREIVGGSE